MTALIAAIVLFSGAGVLVFVCDCVERAQRNRIRLAQRRPRVAQSNVRVVR